MDNCSYIWSSSSANGRRNFERGLSTQTWGTKTFAEVAPLVVFGHTFSGGNPRVDGSIWEAGEADIVVCQLTSQPYRGIAPHWQDEVESGTVIYPHRFGFTPIAQRRISLRPDGPLGADGAEALRLSAIRSIITDAPIDRDLLFQHLDITVLPTGTVNLGVTPGKPSVPKARGLKGAGRSQDAAFNKAVEDQAVKVATTHLYAQDWDDIEPLGKPFDLVCKRRNGQEKHVEVKGATGAGAFVEFTPNEVEHFRNCPHGADLIVVRDIEVDRHTDPYTATGGTLLHLEGYKAPAEDLQATGWVARVQGW